MFWQKQNKWRDSKRFLRKLWSTQARPLAGIDQTIKNQAKLRQRERTICPKGYFFYTWTPLSCPMNVNILLSNKISQPFDSINVCQMHSATLNVLDLLVLKTILQQQRLSTDLPQPNPDVFNSNYLLRKYILHIPFRGSTQKSSSRSLLIKHPTKLRWKVGPWLLFKRNRALN